MAVSFIPAGTNFLRTLMDVIHSDSKKTQTALYDYTILLSTRRAVRTIKASFVENMPTLLPRIHAMGDLDDAVLTLQSTDIGMAAAISPTARLGLLIGLIQDQHNMPWPRAQALAAALAKLLDEAALREVSLSALETLVPDDFAAHWGITLDWLKIIIQRWPEMLAARGQVDAATARQDILNGYAALWHARPPVHPIIAAGSTGSLPATRRLLQCIAGLPRGMVVLPALDTDLPDDVWNNLSETHPQRPLFNLLSEFNMQREDVFPLDGQTRTAPKLWQQVLLPADATHAWRAPEQRLIKPGQPTTILDNLHTVTAPDAETEACVIAIILQRAAVENKTAALITPDRTLARRVASHAARFGIAVNDSAGDSLADSRAGTWARQYLLAAKNNFDGVSFLSLLKHPLSCFGVTRAECRAEARNIEKQWFRSKTPVNNLAELLAAAGDEFTMRGVLSTLTHPVEKKSMANWAQHLMDTAAALTAEPGSAALLWQHDDGKKLLAWLEDLREHSACYPPVSLSDFYEFLEEQTRGVPLHAPDTHPHIQILGPLEARLHAFDVSILGGLNEGTWPADAAPDPWLSRPMRAQMQLATPDEMLALAAHDFYQLATQEKVYLTRTAFADGAPTLPSRWWQRLMNYLQACGLPADAIEEADLIRAASTWDDAPVFAPAPRPAPMPPAAQRPRRYSPSSIETLVRNPYEFYARYVLSLRVLPGINQPRDAADEGSFLHDVLHAFTHKFPSQLPVDASKILDDLAAERMAKLPLDAMEKDFGWQNWQGARDNFLNRHSRAVHAGRRVVAMEHVLSADLPTPMGPVTLHARADRIDMDASGHFIIVDYKRKNAPTKSEAVNFIRPQLLIEAWLLNQCGMDGFARKETISGEFWPLLQDNIIVPDDERFKEAVVALPDRLGTFIAHYLDAENAFTAQSVEKPFDDQQYYLDLSRMDEWPAGAAA